MAKSIWKFPLKVTDSQTIPMPKGAQILDIQDQDGGLYLWALVDTESPKVGRIIDCFGTGHPCNVTNEKYLRTIQQGPFVWNFFDRG